MLFIGISVVLITMAAVKVDADTREGMPRMFFKKPCAWSEVSLVCSSGAGSKGAVSCREPPAPGQQEEGKGPWQVMAALWVKASGALGAACWHLLGKVGNKPKEKKNTHMEEAGDPFIRFLLFRMKPSYSSLFFHTFLFNYTEASGDCSTNVQ